jgi:hypothetical protein
MLNMLDPNFSTEDIRSANSVFGNFNSDQIKKQRPPFKSFATLSSFFGVPSDEELDYIFRTYKVSRNRG